MKIRLLEPGGIQHGATGRAVEPVEDDGGKGAQLVFADGGFGERSGGRFLFHATRRVKRKCKVWQGDAESGVAKPSGDGLTSTQHEHHADERLGEIRDGQSPLRRIHRPKRVVRDALRELRTKDDPAETDSQELAELLLPAVRGPHRPLTARHFEALRQRARRKPARA